MTTKKQPLFAVGYWLHAEIFSNVIRFYQPNCQKPTAKG